jgi:hypothetical protein
VWFLFHHNQKTQVVDGGESFVETCPECGRRARFDEVEISENVGVFFVDLVSDKERKFRCSACGNTFELQDDAGAATEPPARSDREAREIERERATAAARQRAEDQRRDALAADQRQRGLAEHQRRELAEAKANRIEDELAELKKRLGR